MNPESEDVLSKMTSADFYHEPYARVSHHEYLLKDIAVMTPFRDVILQNSHLFKNKIVMELGSGTGILSLFAAQAGARKVIAVEPSNMAVMSKKIIKENRLDHIVEVVHKKLEDITELPDGIKKVDIIISNWVGYSMYCDSLISEVIYARDTWLSENGMIFPDRAKLYLCAIEARKYKHDHIEYWSNVFDFNMSAIKNVAVLQPLFVGVDKSRVISNGYCIKVLNAYTMTAKDLLLEANFGLKVSRNDYVSCLATYFMVEFTKSHLHEGFSTAPDARPTHFKQAIFYLIDSFPVREGEMVTGTFTMKPIDTNLREFDVNISIVFRGEISDFIHENCYRLKQQVHGIPMRTAFNQLRMEGLKYLYRGYLPLVIQRTTQRSLMFGTYDTYRNLIGAVRKKDTVSLGPRHAIAAILAGSTEALFCPLSRVRNFGTLQHDKCVRLSSEFIAGGVLGGMISTVCYPFSVVKNKMQANLGGEFRSPYQDLKIVLHEKNHSIIGFYRGAMLNFMRSCLSWGITNVVYEMLHTYLDS